MKLSTFAYIGFASLIIGLVPQKANALPFDENSCASMQNYYNQLKWNPSRKFSGFENSKPFFNQIARYVTCHNGYMTETSPMGTRICKAYIRWKIDFREPTMYVSDKDRDCRWK